ncbi:MAG: aminotransferase class V-fold PLP-dependent enzyme [Bacillota bacterium]|nr:aminotransferase class V-fold PLP-dependent enzyme [Bacillota bacterium]
MQGLVYLDNAATTWPKPDAVYTAIDECLRREAANPGRSSHRMSVAAQKVLDDARLLTMRLFNAPSPHNVVFTLNCTDSLNIAIKGLARPRSRIAVGPYEHNSVARPLVRLERNGVVLLRARGTDGFLVDLDHLEDLCRDGVDLAVISHVSNVTGRVQPVKDIADIVHRSGGLLLLDAAQSAGVLSIDMHQMGIDMLAAPGHKSLYGPMGVGLLVMADNVSILPLREGGTGYRSEDDEHPSDLPWALEAGTPNLPGIAGLVAGIRFIGSVGLERISSHEVELASRLTKGLSEIPGVHPYCGTPRPETGLVSFTIGGIDSAVASVILDQKFGIALRAGLHCAPWAHRALGTLECGTLRASIGWYNTLEHIDCLISAVSVIQSQYAF